MLDEYSVGPIVGPNLAVLDRIGLDRVAVQVVRFE
jgi:hypothetical protein